MQKTLKTVPTIGCGGQAQDMLGSDLPHHALEIERRGMVAFVDNHLPILAHQIADTLAGGQALDHGYIDAPRRFLSAAADLSHFLGAEPQEALKLGTPLVQEGLAVDEHQGVYATQSGHVGTQHRLPGTGRSYNWKTANSKDIR